MSLEKDLQLEYHSICPLLIHLLSKKLKIL